MKTLILIRHGKAEYGNFSTDKMRKLTDEGVRRSLKVANESGLILTSDFKWYSSTGSRAAQTSIIFSEILNVSNKEITFLEELYTFDFSQLNSLISSLSDSFDKIVVFGHNGALTDFVNENTINTIDEIPTSGLVAIEFETKSWKNLPKGKVIKTLFAKEL